MKNTMKKTALTTLFASLFSVVVAGGAIASASHDSETQVERKMIKIELDQEQQGPAVIEIDVDGDHHVFEFSQEELQDLDAIEAQLANLDEKVREAVMNAITGLKQGPGEIVWEHHDGEQHDKQVFIFNSSAGADTDAEVIIDMAKSGDFKQLHKIIETHIGDAGGAMKFKIGNGHKFEFHSDGKHNLSVIEKLIESSDLTSEQLDAIAQMVEQKRQ